MTQKEMFEASFLRPADFFNLTPAHQWEIDSRLGILDWQGEGLSADDIKRFENHYQ